MHPVGALLMHALMHSKELSTFFYYFTICIVVLWLFWSLWSENKLTLMECAVQFVKKIFPIR